MAQPMMTTTAQPAATVTVLGLLGKLAGSDKNADGLLSKQEIATAALTVQPDSAEFSLLYSMLLGGTDHTGLFPDKDNDGSVSVAELSEFAGLSGNKNAFEASDFTAGFGARANETEPVNTQEVLAKLKNISEGRAPGDNGTVGGGVNDMLGFFRQFLELMTNLLRMLAGGGQGPMAR